MWDMGSTRDASPLSPGGCHTSPGSQTDRTTGSSLSCSTPGWLKSFHVAVKFLIWGMLRAKWSLKGLITAPSQTGFERQELKIWCVNLESSHHTLSPLSPLLSSPLLSSSATLQPLKCTSLTQFSSQLPSETWTPHWTALLWDKHKRQ